MADLELHILKRGRAYECLMCSDKGTPYTGERRQVVAHIYKYHVPLDQTPFYCSLCHFIAEEKEKLVAHVKNYSKHKEAIKSLRERGLPEDNYLRENPNAVYLVEGNHFNRLSRDASRDHWTRTYRPPTSSAPPPPSAIETPSVPAMEPALPAAAEETRADLPAITSTLHFDDLVEEDFNFLDRYLGISTPAAGTSTSVAAPAVGRPETGLAPRKVDVKRKRDDRSSNSSDDSDSSESSDSSDEEEDGEKEIVKTKQMKRGEHTEKETGKIRQLKKIEHTETVRTGQVEKEDHTETETGKPLDEKNGRPVRVINQVLPELEKMNQNLFLIYTAVNAINEQMKSQNELLQRFIERGGRDTNSRNREGSPERRRDRSPVRRISPRKHYRGGSRFGFRR